MIKFTQDEVDSLTVQKIRHEIQSDFHNSVDSDKLAGFLYKHLPQMKSNLSVQSLQRDENGKFLKI